MTLTARAAALLLGAGLCLTACAQPGQLGQPVPAPAPAPAAGAPAPGAPAPAPARAPVAPPPAGQVGAGQVGTEQVSGTVDSRVTIRTPGPSVYSVRTVLLAPGASIGWLRHPGTVMAVVRHGQVTLVRQNACDPVRYREGQALFVADAVPHRLTNTGPAPAELLVTMLLAPGVAESTTVDAACPA